MTTNQKYFLILFLSPTKVLKKVEIGHNFRKTNYFQKQNLSKNAYHQGTSWGVSIITKLCPDFKKTNTYSNLQGGTISDVYLESMTVTNAQPEIQILN